MNPCGVGTGETISEAFQKAYEADSTSIFGGIVALNNEVDQATASNLLIFSLEIVIAPSFTEEAIAMLTKKKNIRLLTISFEQQKKDQWNTVSVEGGLLMQQPDTYGFEEADIKVVTDREPTEEEWNAMKLGWSSCETCEI